MQNNHSAVRFNPFKVNIKAVIRETLTQNRGNVDYSFNIKTSKDCNTKSELLYQDHSYQNDYNTENDNYLLENIKTTNKLNLYNTKTNTFNKVTNEKSNIQNNSFLEGKLDLNQYLVTNPTSNFIIRVKGDSMSKVGINTGDLLIVDRSAKVTNNKIVVAAINDELLVKRIRFAENTIQLISENDQYQPISIRREDNFDIWGVVKSVIKTM